MAITVVNLSKVFDGTDTTVYSTGSITITSGSIAIFGVMGKRSVGASVTPTIGGTLAATWTQIQTDQFNTIAVSVARCAWFRTFLASSLTGTITATFAAAQDAAWLVVDQLLGAASLNQVGGSNKADSASGRTQGGFTNLGPNSILYGISFVGLSVAIAPGGTETEVAEQQGGAGLEAGAVQTEFLVNTTSISASWTAADCDMFAGIFSGADDDPLSGSVGSSLLASRKGSL